ncbi:MAG: ATP-binding cassette domain-containing protein, partial [Spirochaetaceae bacterium]|nr:ATP-binding cassette domain-containing protein [Spirochaetaceae bacterium]
RPHLPIRRRARRGGRRRGGAAPRGGGAPPAARAAPAASSGAALMAALRAVGRHERIAVREPASRSDEPPTLAAVLRATGVRSRRVRLSARDRWWRGDSGAMVAFRREGGAPVALLPGTTGRYRLYDPQTGGSSPIRRSDAAELADHGYVLYPRLPDGGPVGLRTLLATAAGRFGADLARVVAAGCMAAVLALAPAAGIGVLVERVIPSSDHRALLQLAALLVLLAFMGALAHVLRGTAVMRVEARLAARATAALWDRLLRLPIRFHREYSSGEISTRALAFQAVRDRLSGAAGAALLSVLFLAPSICLVLLYDAVLGSVSLGIGIIALAVTVALGAAQLAPGRRRFREERLLAGRMSQFIDCIRKLQAAGAGQSARAAWARRYRAQKLAEMRVGVLDEHLRAFSAAVPLIAAAALLAVSAARQDGALGVGDFVVVYVGSMIFYAAIIALGGAFEAVASVIPACEQILPVLAATPEDGGGQGPPVVLGGGLRFDSVSFRYGDAGPPVLDRVTWYAEPGEFVAIVGESGAGKSTLVRVALGLETPTGGAVYYDDHDLAHLDRTSVRRQIGVVLQDGGSHAGTVLDNIIGLDQDLNVDDAWRAARLAAVDRDIAAMPMQMHTGMGERAAVVSGGQSQRILIAAALVRNPRIVFLDEATNWLDRTNQAAVMEGLRTSTATRIVIAHRMSTIRAAHRIYVLEAGRVVQVGRFDELAGTDGPFRDLVRRQMP